jgi:hypothetical protein
MKNILLSLITLSCLSGNKLFAQPTWTCHTSTSPTAMIASPSQPSSCVDFLNDFIPAPSDPVVEVKVRFYVFTPTVGTGNWDNATTARAQDALTYANFIFSDILINTWSVSPQPAYIKDTRIRFVMDGPLNMIADEAAYYYVQGAQNNYGSTTAINVFYGCAWPTSTAAPFYYMNGASVDYPVPNPNVLFHRGIPGVPQVEDLGDLSNAGTLAHELGHALGLEENFANTSYGTHSGIAPAQGCCEVITASDYLPEATIIRGGCNDSVSNNLMSPNTGCHRYLSPQQMAIMHYNLRGPLQHVLTSQGYQNASLVNHNLNYTVTASETWTADRYMKGDILVRSGQALTVKCLLTMTHGARIIVEKGGLLSVDGGTITSPAGRVWEGIELLGDPQLPATLSASGMPVFQGMARFMNATISHARRAVSNHKNGEYGGIILASHSRFLDNQTDVEFRGHGNNAIPVVKGGRFYNCDFKTTTYIGDNLLPVAHISLHNVVDAMFYGCNFEYAAGSTYLNTFADGIYSMNSSFYVDKNGATPCTFKKLARGIYMNNINPLRIPSIQNSRFIDNQGYGAYFMNVNYLKFEYNTVQVPGAVSAWCGVYLNNCKYYTIRNNSFLEDLAWNFKTTPGIEIFNSGAGSHQVYRNTFSNLFIGINAMGNNSGLSNSQDGLRMNCNDFTQTSNAYDITLTLGTASTAPSVMHNQGILNGILGAEPVRNMYAATCLGSNGNQWYVHSSSSKPINHINHISSSNGESTSPAPQPACSRTVVDISTIAGSLNYTLDCGPHPPSGPTPNNSPFVNLGNLNDYLINLREDELNNGSDHHFEIQATVASRLNLFLTDTLLKNIDSVITILANNQGRMDDADLQLAFAYMEKGAYNSASLQLNDILSGNPEKEDWVLLLDRLLRLQRDSVLGLDSLNLSASLRDFFLGYASTDGKDGQSLARAILKIACDSSYTEPHNYPEEEEAEDRRAQHGSLNENNAVDISGDVLKLFPNPTQAGLQLEYSSSEPGPVKVELRDLPGKIIFTTFIESPSAKAYIPMEHLSNGMYLISLSRNGALIFKDKVIKHH